MPDVADYVLALAVLDEDARHKQRSPGRKAARHLWVCLMITSTTAEARAAIGSFGDEDTQRGAAELLDRLTGAERGAPANDQAERTRGH